MAKNDVSARKLAQYVEGIAASYGVSTQAREFLAAVGADYQDRVSKDALRAQVAAFRSRYGSRAEGALSSLVERFKLDRTDAQARTAGDDTVSTDEVRDFVDVVARNHGVAVQADAFLREAGAGSRGGRVSRTALRSAVDRYRRNYQHNQGAARALDSFEARFLTGQGAFTQAANGGGSYTLSVTVTDADLRAVGATTSTPTHEQFRAAAARKDVADWTATRD